MDELDELKKLEKVKAPSDFEQRVFSQLFSRKEKKTKLRKFRFSLAGVSGAAAVIVFIVGIFILPTGEKTKVSEKQEGYVSILDKKEAVREENYIPIVEPVKFEREIQTRQKHTVYILEQVSESTKRKVKY
ncbi:hypothetical protein KGY73_00705 [bacterium]|nr:hypothetical protein [bacterium]